MQNKIVCLWSVLLGLALSCTSVIGAGTDDLDSFLEMDLEELLSVEITSVSKRKQQISQAAAAVFVISNEDIRRSGVTSIPEALRLAPGIQVARLDNNTWAISSRGFNAEFANKLLVLIDGRSVYTPTFAGVYWEDQDTVLADIDRIEVIRGPGATVWGANAVNGVINIITKSAVETQGTLAQLSAGDEEKAIVQLRHGATFGDDIAARAYLKFADRDTSYSPEFDGEANDDWQSRRAGFRLDGGNNSDSWTLQGDIYNNNNNQTNDEIWVGPDDPLNNSPFPNTPALAENVEDTVKSRGNNLLARWETQLSADSLATLQLYADHTRRSEAIMDQKINTYDVDFSLLYSGLDHHDIIWGLGYRRIDDDFNGTFAVDVVPSRQTSELFSGFIQDEITLKDNLWLTLGSKLEHNVYTDFELQPTVKLLWLPKPSISVWSSYSRAVRTPSAAERRSVFNRGFLFGPMPVIITNFGDDGNDSENLLALEMGLRMQLSESTSFDLALFSNDYRSLSTAETQSVQSFPNPMNPTGPPIQLPATSVFVNGMEATSRGGELVIDWQATANWRLQSSYSYLNTTITSNENDGATSISVEGGSPDHTLTLRSLYDYSDDISIDLWVYYVDELESTAGEESRSQKISSYTSVNMRLAWQPIENMELSLVGQNLTDARHPEFIGQFFILPTEVERSFYGKISYKF